MIPITGRAAAGTAAALVAAGIARRWRHVRAVAPELRTAMTWVPLAVTNGLGLRIGRQMFTRATTPVSGVTVAERTTPATDGTSAVRYFVYDPRAAVAGQSAPARAGALVWMHGGGLILGVPEGDHELCSKLARDTGAVVVNVDYRLAPDHPFPSGLEDCYAVLSDIYLDADELGVDVDRIAVGGASAGGGLAAALAQLAHDRAEVPVRFQLLVYPMLDDRTVLRRRHAGRNHLAWTPSSNAYAWTAYLGHPPRWHSAQPYASPSRRVNVTGLPAAWVGVGDLDLFYEEDVAYAGRLREAEVACEVYTVAGMPHGADVATPHAPTMARFYEEMARALRDGLDTEPPRSTDPDRGQGRGQARGAETRRRRVRGLRWLNQPTTERDVPS